MFVAGAIRRASRGRGAQAPDITQTDYLLGFSASSHAHFTRKGRAKKMPGVQARRCLYVAFDNITTACIMPSKDDGYCQPFHDDDWRFHAHRMPTQPPSP